MIVKNAKVVVKNLFRIKIGVKMILMNLPKISMSQIYYVKAAIVNFRK